MSKNKKSKILNQEAPFLFIAILAFVLFMADLVLFEDHVKGGWVLGVSNKADEKIAPGQSKKLENVNPSSVKAKSHVEKVKNVVTKLEEISAEEEGLGNNDISGDIEEAVEDIEEGVVGVAVEIEEIEERPAWKNFLFGTDYKNLGRLRSSLVSTNNGIRKINSTMVRVEGTDSYDELGEQLGELNRERERIVDLIKEEEERFSLFGWVVRLLNGETDVGAD
jgi:hypothetical protein